MRRPSRVRRIAKWAGVGICTVVAIVWVVSGSWNVVYQWRHGDLWVYSGRLHYTTLVAQPTHRPPKYGLSSARHKWHWVWSPYTYVDYSTSPYVAVACWIPFLIVALPTGILFWRDRRRIPPGHCKKCGYDLTGNTSGRCPECGKGVRP